MNPADDCRETNTEPLAIDLLLTADQRRTVTPDRHQAFRESIASPARAFDEVDRALDDDLVGDPSVERFARARKASQAARILDILDELERSGHE